jgi:hypothetical protein
MGLHHHHHQQQQQQQQELLDELRCWSGNKQTSLVGAVMAME